MASQSLNLNGAPDAAVFGDAAVVGRFEPLVEPIRSSLGERSVPLADGKAELDAGSLAQLTFAIQAFQHKQLEAQAAAASSSAPRPTKIPASCFLFANRIGDFDAPLTTEAPVFHLLRSALDFLSSQDKSSWAFLSSDATDDVALGTQMVAHVRTQLKQAGAIKTIKIAASPDLTEAEKDGCKEMAAKLDCKFEKRKTTSYGSA